MQSCGTNNVFICFFVYLSVTQKKTAKAVNDNACGIQYRSYAINIKISNATMSNIVNIVAFSKVNIIKLD